MLPKVRIYTDGACNPNPGPGGWGAVLMVEGGGRPLELSGAETDTTNNRMELRAAIESLASLSGPHRVVLFTDSKYLKRGITQWLANWRRSNWQTATGTAVKNKDLWQALAAKIEPHTVQWQWLKGHGNNRWNERADALARGAIPHPPLPLNDVDAIHLFAGVACQSKTHAGGWGVVLRFRKRVKVLCGHVSNTTGNRMHITAAVEGLATIKRSYPIHLYTYSGYLKDGATRWVRQWAATGWRTKEGSPVRHRDLWARLDRLAKRYDIQWHVADKSNPPCHMQAAKLLAGEMLPPPDAPSPPD